MNGDAVGDLRRGVRKEVVSGKRTLVLRSLQRSELARERVQQVVADPAGGRTDEPEIAPEPAPGLFVGRRDPNLDLDARSGIAAREDAQRPGDFREAGVFEPEELLRRGRVDEGNVELPDFTDGPHRDFAVGLGKKAKTRLVGRDDVVDSHCGGLDLVASKARGDRPDREERANQGGPSQVAVADEPPRFVRGDSHVDVIELEPLRFGNE